jgi:hypothetical protein
MRTFGVPLISLAVWLGSASGQEAAQSGGRSLPLCTSAHIVFDASSVEYIFLRPEDVLAKDERFWEEDSAYRLAKLWHKLNNVPIPLAEWRKDITQLVSTPSAERSTHAVFTLARALADSHGEFMNRALPHICSFLPKTDVKLDTTVYFTAYTRARGFMMNDNIVINIMHPYWHGDRQHLLNAIAHEIFHIGYGRNPATQALQTLARQNDDRFHQLGRQLQNEGMATYVAYKALSMYSATAEKDYELLANPADVMELRRKLNALFGEAATLSGEEMQKRSWDIGVMQRAYYVVGADMARMIESKIGRKALIDTITKGPRSYITTYNAGVPAVERIAALPSTHRTPRRR